MLKCRIVSEVPYLPKIKVITNFVGLYLMFFINNEHLNSLKGLVLNCDENKLLER